MKLPLIITDSDGNILYTDRSVKVSTALRMFANTTAKSNNDGLVFWNGKSIYTKEILLKGERLRFFIDSEKLCEYFGVEADMLANGIFDIPKSFKNRASVSLKTLVRIFADEYSKKLFKNGVHLSVRGLLFDKTVNVSPNAFALCLALMVRLAANDGSSVTLAFTEECGRIAIYADSVGGKPTSDKAKELLQTMLYEASAAAGFAVEEAARGAKTTFVLHLEPLDISLLGFKAPSLEKYKKVVEIYIEMFL